MPVPGYIDGAGRTYTFVLVGWDCLFHATVFANLRAVAKTASSVDVVVARKAASAMLPIPHQPEYDRSVLSDSDISYIQAGFIPLDELCRQRHTESEEIHRLIEQHILPRPSYVFADGTEMVPADYFMLYDMAGAECVQKLFRDRFAQRAKELGVRCTEAELRDEWDGYLSGLYGVCLHEVTPENICSKGFHMTAIEELIRDPRPSNGRWLETLAHHVNALDELERPFAEFDRVRWGLVSRDRLITAVRRRFPQAFPAPGAE